MTQHTPGPLRAEKGHEDEPERWVVLADKPRAYLIAVIENGQPGDTLETEGATARLFAAAPELLAACELKLAALKGKEYDPEAFDQAITACELAISKAAPPVKTPKRARSKPC